MKKIRFHDTRHTAASTMLREKVSMKELQLILGHSDFSTTANIYSHLDFSDKISAGKKMSQAIFGDA